MVSYDGSSRSTSSDEETRPEFKNTEVKGKILELVEHYLSDENVLKDRFLLKHIRRNKEGYVSIKLMTSYRKVKSLTKDWNLVASSVKQSTVLELNAEGNRVRRKTPLPEYEEHSLSKSVIAYKFPFDKPTVDKVGLLFASCGDIFLMQILRPGCNVPTDVRKLFTKNPELATEICALIEFEDEKSIKIAADIKEAKVTPLIELRDRSKKRRNKKKNYSRPVQSPNTSSFSNFNDKYSPRSGSVSSGYLSSSPTSSCFELRQTSQVSPSMGDYRNYRRNNCVGIIRLPKGPDGTKGFTEVRKLRSS